MDNILIKCYELFMITILPISLLINNEQRIKQVDNSIAKEMVTGSFFGLYDPAGKKIKITYNKDQTLTFSSNATADIIKIANGMAKSKIGLKTLRLMDASNTRISITIDTASILSNNDGTYIAAETYPIITTVVNESGKLVGPKYISEAQIVIFEAAIKDIAQKNDGKILIHGVIIETRYFPISDIISSFTIHELIHVLDNKFSGSLNPTATKAELEKKPYEIQLQHFKELKEKMAK